MKFILFIILSICYSEATPHPTYKPPTNRPTAKPTSSYQTYNVKYDVSKVETDIFLIIEENKASSGANDYDEFYSEFNDDVEEAIAGTASVSKDHPPTCLTQDYILDKPNYSITVDVDIKYYWTEKDAMNTNQRSTGSSSFPAKMQYLLRDRYNSTTLIFSVDYDSISIDAANTLSIICTIIAVCVAIFGTI